MSDPAPEYVPRPKSSPVRSPRPGSASGAALIAGAALVAAFLGWTQPRRAPVPPAAPAPAEASRAEPSPAAAPAPAPAQNPAPRRESAPAARALGSGGGTVFSSPAAPRAAAQGPEKKDWRVALRPRSWIYQGGGGPQPAAPAKPATPWRPAGTPPVWHAGLTGDAASPRLDAATVERLKKGPKICAGVSMMEMAGAKGADKGMTFVGYCDSKEFAYSLESSPDDPGLFFPRKGYSDPAESRNGQRLDEVIADGLRKGNTQLYGFGR